MKIHELKSWPQFFEKIVDGSKTFEVRLNDRNFKVGDFLFLREYNPETKQYSGRFQYVRVTYILGSEEHNLVSPKALHPDYVILAIMLTWSTQSPVPQGQEQAPQARPEPFIYFREMTDDERENLRRYYVKRQEIVRKASEHAVGSDANSEPDWLCSQPDCGLWHSEHGASPAHATAAAGAESTAGPNARVLLDLPDSGTIKLAPGDHGEWDIFIQSTSTNRVLLPGTSVLHWRQ